MAATQPDASIAAAFGNRFAIPLDFEILTDHGSFYQAGLNDRLSFELSFNDYGRVIMSTDPTASTRSLICRSSSKWLPILTWRGENVSSI